MQAVEYLRWIHLQKNGKTIWHNVSIEESTREMKHQCAAPVATPPLLLLLLLLATAPPALLLLLLLLLAAPPPLLLLLLLLLLAAQKKGTLTYGNHNKAGQ